MDCDLVCTARTLATDAACVEVLRRFADHGIDAILLKGRTTAEWLYPDQPRAYTDADLLVDPGRVLDAAAVLEELGFEPVSWYVSDHAHPWIRPSDGATVDLHATIWGPTREAAQVWAELQRVAVRYQLGPVWTRALSIPARALHIVLHAAQHRDNPRNPEDLRRALAATRLEDWRAAERLADRLRALVPMAQGLMLEPDGRALLERLPLARAAARVDLNGALLAVGLARIALASGPRDKAAVVVRALRPEAPGLRGWKRARAHLERLAWLLSGVAPTVRAQVHELARRSCARFVTCVRP